MSPGSPADALVLCYHAVSPTWPAALSVTPEQFGRQVGRVLSSGYDPVTFAAAVQARPGEKVVAFTFDDAYRSVLEQAHPVLDRAGAPATVFVPTAHAGTPRPMAWPGIEHWLGGRHERELVPLQWPELSDLAAAGWEIGSHTQTHPRLTTLDDEGLRQELVASRETCEQRLGQACPSIAYPYGDVDDRVAHAAEQAGYRFGAALPGSPRAHDPLRYPRVGIYHRDRRWRFEAKVSRPLRRARSSAWTGPALEAAISRSKFPL
ncbi:MAG: polysaccharide deacetylase family protein [Solirubrobacterales bacterium]|nr:polysaccharide deacetylase family protein [Solirubrobacterales bacterium]